MLVSTAVFRRFKHGKGHVLCYVKSVGFRSPNYFSKVYKHNLVQRISPVERRKTTGQMMGTYRGNTNKILTLGVSRIHLNVTVRTLAR